MKIHPPLSAGRRSGAKSARVRKWMGTRLDHPHGPRLRLSTKAEESEILAPAPAFGLAFASRRWRVAGLWTIAAIVAILLIHLPTVGSFLRVWHQDRAFAHCYFIVPLAGYMIWLNRERLALLSPKPSIRGLVSVILGCGALFLSTLAQVQFGAQFALVVIVVGTIWAVLGDQVTREIAYPLAFLFLAVPFGETFFPILINIAGHLAVWMIAPLGAPIALDGKYVRLPGAEWTIAEACGGLRFILALLSVGAVYAYTTYRKPWKRALFLLSCLILAVLTNGVRVSAILLIGYFTDMKSSIVHEHTWLGWLLFALMALALFFIGRHWADPERDPSASPPSSAGSPGLASHTGGRSNAVAGMTAMAIVLVWSLGAKGAERPVGGNAVSLSAPAGSDGWTALDYPLWDWSPYYKGARASFATTYQKGNRDALAFVAYYRNQGEGSELIHAENGVVSPDRHDWRVSADARRTISAGNQTFDVMQTDIRSPVNNLRVWRWYWSRGRVVTDPVALKLLTLQSRLTGHGDDAAVVVVAAAFDDKPEEASETLTAFLRGNLPGIAGALRNASARSAPMVK